MDTTALLLGGLALLALLLAALLAMSGRLRRGDLRGTRPRPGAAGRFTVIPPPPGGWAGARGSGGGGLYGGTVPGWGADFR
jgi:hypothetical protein